MGLKITGVFFPTQKKKWFKLTNNRVIFAFVRSLIHLGEKYISNPVLRAFAVD